MSEEEVWVEVRVDAKKRKNLFVQHGIGRSVEEAVKTVQLPEGYKLKDVTITRKDIVPEEFQMFHELEHFKDVREQRKSKK